MKTRFSFPLDWDFVTDFKRGVALSVYRPLIKKTAHVQIEKNSSKLLQSFFSDREIIMPKQREDGGQRGSGGAREGGIRNIKKPCQSGFYSIGVRKVSPKNILWFDNFY